MRLEAPKSAFMPFLDSVVSILPRRGRMEAAVPFSVPACVMETDPYALGNGIGEEATPVSFSVSILADDARNPIIPGAEIEADESRGRPRLYINSVHRNGPLLHFECTALERGRS